MEFIGLDEALKQEFPELSEFERTQILKGIIKDYEVGKQAYFDIDKKEKIYG